MLPDYSLSELPPEPRLLDWLDNEMKNTSASIADNQLLVNQLPLAVRAMRKMTKTVMINAARKLQGTGLLRTQLLSWLDNEMNQTSEEIKLFKRYHDPETGKPLDYIVKAIDDMKTTVIDNAKTALVEMETAAIPAKSKPYGEPCFGWGYTHLTLKSNIK